MHEKSGNSIQTGCAAGFWVTLARAYSLPSLPGLLPLVSSSLLSFFPFFEYELMSPNRLTSAVSLSSFTEMSQHLSQATLCQEEVLDALKYLTFSYGKGPLQSNRTTVYVTLLSHLQYLIRSQGPLAFFCFVYLQWMQCPSLMGRF